MAEDKKAKKTEERKQEEHQQKLMQFQFLQQNIQLMQQQIQQLTAKIQEISQARQTLEDLEKLKPSTSFIPIGAGNYIAGRVESSNEVLVTFGAGVAVKKNMEEAKKITSSREEEHKKILSELSRQAEVLSMHMKLLQSQIQEQQ